MRCKYVPNRPNAPSCVHWKNPATLFTHLVLRASDNLTFGQGNTESKRSGCHGSRSRDRYKDLKKNEKVADRHREEGSEGKGDKRR